MFAAMVDFPVFFLFILFWLVIVPVALYLIIRTAVEHGIRRARRERGPRFLAALAERQQEDPSGL